MAWITASYDIRETYISTIIYGDCKKSSHLDM